jgi:hypothetical protein
MCGLCGFWRTQTHWSMRSQNPKVFGAIGYPSDLLRERSHQTAALNRVTRAFGVSVRDWESSRWILESVNGGCEIVDSIATMWPAIEMLSRCKVDPLSRSLLETLSRHDAGQEA